MNNEKTNSTPAKAKHYARILGTWRFKCISVDGVETGSKCLSSDNYLFKFDKKGMASAVILDGSYETTYQVDQDTVTFGHAALGMIKLILKGNILELGNPSTGVKLIFNRA